MANRIGSLAGVVNARPTALPGVLHIIYERVTDERGWFERTFDRERFAALGLCVDFPQHARARNARRGTVRGLHFQAEPYGETKLIACVRGTAFDVLVDLRPGEGYGRHLAVRLSEDVAEALYVPPGIAHGYQTLSDDAELSYLLSAEYRPEAARGVRWDSPALAIAWPLPAAVVSERDRSLPAFTPRAVPGSP